MVLAFQVDSRLAPEAITGLAHGLRRLRYGFHAELPGCLGFFGPRSYPGKVPVVIVVTFMIATTKT